MPESPLLPAIAQMVRAIGRIPEKVSLSATTRLVEDLNIDSLDLVDLIVRIQDEFGVEVAEEDLPRLRSLGDLATYVSERRSVLAA